MKAVLDIKAQELSGIDLESLYEMNPCSKNGVFRRYHVKNNPINYFDPSGLLCGSGWIDAIVPDVPAGYNFRNCCARHDYCYGDECQKSKHQCDNEIFNCLDDVCYRKHRFDRSCTKYAKMYYKAVHKYGGNAFRKARKGEPCCGD